ncbi:hypothetical protein ACQKH3_38590, partial [Streptomyces niveus]
MAMSSLPTGTGPGPGTERGTGNGTDAAPDAVDDSRASAGRRRRGDGRGASGVAGWPFVVPFLV